MKTSQRGFVKTALVVLAVLCIVVVFVGWRLSVRYTNNPFAAMQDSYALSSDATKADMLAKATKIRFTGNASQANKLKQESGSYVGICESPFVVGGNGYSGINNLYCNESKDSYVISGSISPPSKEFMCVDNSDIVRKLDINLSTGETSCPVTASAMP